VSSGGDDRPTEPGQLSGREREILAIAYELSEQQVEDDAVRVRHWTGSDEHLIAALEQLHAWTPESELGRFFLPALRRTLT
jgi:hypothetical protein